MRLLCEILFAVLLAYAQRRIDGSVPTEFGMQEHTRQSQMLLTTAQLLSPLTFHFLYSSSAVSPFGRLAQ